MRIAFFASSLAAGGAERVLSTLANALSSRGHEVVIMTLAPTGEDFFALSPAVGRIGFGGLADSAGLAAAIVNNAGRVRTLRVALRRLRPDVLISFCDQANVVALLASRGLPCKTIVSERTDPSRHGIGAIWSILRRIVYPWADAVVVQTEGVAAWVQREIAAARPAVIPNPVLPPACSPAGHPLERGSELTVIGVGRLSPEKGFDRLLQAFAQVLPGFPDWRLKLVGDGPLRNELENEAARLGLAGKVEFTGNVPAPSTHLMQADLFVLPSRYEGFPNALLEAMAVGLPAISFDCPSGPAAIIRHGLDGLLIPAGDVHALALGMAELMGDKERRDRLGSAGRTVLDRYSLERIVNLWEQKMAEVMA